jgi:putative transposase
VVSINVDALEWLRKQLDSEGDDLLGEMVREFAQRLMAAEVDTLAGAGWGEVSPERVNYRNGYRRRPFDTRVGGIDLAIPKLRRDSYFPDWLLDPRRRGEKALVAVVAECYVRGVSTRRVDGLVKTLGIESLSKSQVSRMAGELDEMVTQFRNRPLDAGPYTYVWMDALTQKVREGGRIINVAVVIAVGVNRDGHREILGLDVITSEDGAGRLAGVSTWPRRPGPGGDVPGDLRCPPRPHRRNRLDAHRSELAEMPHPLHTQSVDPGPEVRAVHGRHVGPHDL